jgi:hypothetical protein
MRADATPTSSTDRRLSSYLQTLSLFSRKPIQESDLLSVAETAFISGNWKSKTSPFSFGFEVAFGERLSYHFSEYISQLNRQNGSKIGIWIEKSIEHGALCLENINAICLDFPFNFDRNGIVVFATIDLKDKMLFDLIDSSVGSETLRVEVSGESWKNVIY